MGRWLWLAALPLALVRAGDGAQAQDAVEHPQRQVRRMP